jgi:hypothetical protein
VYSPLNVTFLLLLAKALFNLNAHPDCVCSVADEKGVLVMGQHCPLHPLKEKWS